MPQINRKRLLLAALALAAAAWTYSNSLIGVDESVITAYRTLQQRVEAAGHRPGFFVFSGRRYWLDNLLLTAFGASPNSRHLHGNAIDIIVLDVNGDGTADAQDVDLVHRILDREIIADRGGLGTYKNEWGFLRRQMVHFDLRGRRARWNR
ncbi:MAG TPA: hypothetical protein VLV83_25305 [Acidobacteriota bacterium]|nr:hypothetical protein [Acidobacteriota bacterium]